MSADEQREGDADHDDGPPAALPRRGGPAAARAAVAAAGHDRCGDDGRRDRRGVAVTGRADQRSAALEAQEVGAEVLRRLVALVDVLRHRGEHDAVHRAGQSGTSDDGGAGVSRTCLYATDTGLLAVNGATPVSIS